MKLFFTTLTVLVVAVAFALFAHDDPGYIVINYREWRVETSLILLLAITLLTFIMLYYLVRFIINTRRIPRLLHNWRQQRRMRKARNATTQGLMSLAEGNWQSAEKCLVKHIEFSETPALNYLNAARAAQKLGAIERRDYYLRNANEALPTANIAIALTQAELQINQGQMEQALATLTSLRDRAPKNTRTLKLLMRLYLELHDWERLLELLPKLNKHHLISEDQSREVALRSYSELLKRSSGDNDLKHLNTLWHRVPKQLKQEESLLRSYIHELIKLGAVTDAENILYSSLSKKWDDSLVYLYGIIDSSDLANQLNRAEGWLKNHENNPILLLTVGRLCMRNNLWGKARQYLEASASVSMQAETYKELGSLLEHMGEPEGAREYYRKGLAMIVDGPISSARSIEKATFDQVLPSPVLEIS